MADQAKARATETETSQVKEANEKVSEAQDTKENQKEAPADALAELQKNMMN